jgi:hypothetical protein
MAEFTGETQSSQNNTETPVHSAQSENITEPKAKAETSYPRTLMQQASKLENRDPLPQMGGGWNSWRYKS